MITLIVVFVVVLILGLAKIFMPKKHYMKFVLIISCIVSMIYYDFWEDAQNMYRDRWQEMTLYNIRLKGDVWKWLEVRLPSKADHDYSSSKYDVKIAHRYQLDRKKYTVNVEVNPSNHGWQTTLQILTVSKLNSQVLNVEASWAGNCGLIGKTSKTGRWQTPLDKIESLGYPFFTDPKAIGFAWRPTRSFCTDDSLETPEQASSFPIIIKVFDDGNLIGEEQIDFEIFENGIKKYIVMP